MDLARCGGQDARASSASAPSAIWARSIRMATGVLPLVLGRMTRLCQFYTSSEKAYEGTIRLGFATDTYDADGEPVGAPARS